MGTGTDVAIESAGITLVKGYLSAIAKAVRIRGAAMSFSSLSVVGNALRLRKIEM